MRSFVMHTENNPDFKNVWQLAHNWAGDDPNKTNTSEISAIWKGYRIFLDDSFFSEIFDFFHYLKFLQCLRKNKFDKNHLSKLCVKRNEVINWCNDVVLLDPPSWRLQKKSSSTENLSDEDDENVNNGWYDKITERRREKVVCIELAKQLWVKHPGLSYKEMHEHPTMKQLGYSSTFSPKPFKNLVRSVASEPAQMSGQRPKSTE